jgi:DNA-directed RNA polymerase subunit RPC12/RpoP
MMKIRCQRCGRMFTLGRDAIALALAQAQQSHEQYHALDCPHCRHVVKTRIAELRRHLPADYPLPQVDVTVAGPKSETAPESEPSTKPGQ